MGGDPNPGTCPGPCDLTAIENRFSNYHSPDTPAAVYGRGDRIHVKYQRNNHGPGGFVRHTLVRPEDMMKKDVHSRNAFSYSCFGAQPVQARGSELGEDKWGFSLVGNDGKGGIEPGYYVSEVTIPDVVPDGKYVFGWVWYGGTGGPVTNGPYTQEPSSKGYFGDYWSCSYVEIRGGRPLASTYTPVFDNDMSEWSREGCMSANDAPEMCRSEPCKVTATYRRPREFARGSPRALTPNDFGGVREEVEEAEMEPLGISPRSDGGLQQGSTEFDILKNACQCLALGTRCMRRTASKTRGLCERNTPPEYQESRCRDSCCELCRQRPRGSRKVCAATNVRRICG